PCPAVADPSILHARKLQDKGSREAACAPTAFAAGNRRQYRRPCEWARSSTRLWQMEIKTFLSTQPKDRQPQPGRRKREGPPATRRRTRRRLSWVDDLRCCRSGAIAADVRHHLRRLA